MGDGAAWGGLDADKALPPALADRLVAALLEAAAAGPAPGADEAPEGLAADPADSAGGLALDAPRPLPSGLRASLEGALLATPAGPRRRSGRPAWLHPGLAVAAVVALVLVSVGLLTRGGADRQVTAAGPGPTSTTTGAEAPAPDGGAAGSAGDTGSTTDLSAVTAAPAPRVTARPPSRPPAPAPAGPHAPGAGTPTAAPSPAGGEPSAATPAPTPGGTGVTTENSDPGPAPPYAFPATSSDQETQGALAPGAAPGSASPSPAPSRSAPPAGGPPLRIGVAGGDPAQEAGFSAYVDLVNREGGLRGRLLEVVPVAPGTPAPGTIATVNLSPRPVSTPAGAPDWATGPLLETLTATEDLLAGGGRVFSFAGPPERQAHLAADAVFPQLAPTATAVVYRPVTAGPLRDAVPAAFVEVLEQRAVKVFVEDYDPAAPPTHLRSADAAFLSLDTASAGSWLRQAKAAGYAPARGVAGISTLFDPALLADLPEGSRVVSPYLVPGGAEGDAIRSGAGGMSAPVLHGWATAKSLAVALWRTGADTPGAVQTALEGLTGYDSGLAPPYETRPGTRSRTPEGVVFVVRSGAFTADGGFRRDPH